MVLTAAQGADSTRTQIDHILLLFVDGLGIGDPDPHVNPCCHADLCFFRHFSNEFFPKEYPAFGLALAVDAALGVPGLPQSATGQTALLTGINAAALLGKHLSGFPNEKLRQVIAEHSILKRFVESGRSAAFLNTFRQPFFTYNPFDIIRHLSATTVSNLYAGLPFFTPDDLKAGRSIYQDMTGDALLALGIDVPRYTAQRAGEIVGRQSQRYQFCLFEYFQTDRAGHSRDMNRGLHELHKLDAFLGSVLEHVNLKTTLVIVTSDHGNIEDLSVKGHTRNPAMTLLFGAGRESFRHIRSIVDFCEMILESVGVCETQP